LPGQLAIRIDPDVDDGTALARLTGPEGPLAGATLATELRGGMQILALVARTDVAGTAKAEDADRLERAAQADPEVCFARPVFLDPECGLMLIPTDEILVRLEPGVQADRHFGVEWPNVRPLRGTTDQFRVRMAGATASEIFSSVEARMAQGGVVWAEPGFVQQKVKQGIPNDPLFTRQWGLHNTGHGGLADADVDAPEAWDRTVGSSDVVIGVFDDGFQLDHPDLAPNLFKNAGDPVNGKDDDGNGYLDDVNGWDFQFDDNRPVPFYDDDDHGTATSGLAVAAGNNGLGIAGAAYGCRLLPLRYGSSSADDAEAFYYAAGRAADGVGRWRGADVISTSLTFGSTAVVDDALHWAASSGRGGKGCLIFAASGNSADRWFRFRLPVAAGTHVYRWVYSKDSSYYEGADTAWVDSVVFPDGTTERFESGSVPAGWVTGSSAPWVSVQDNVSGNHAMTGWNGPGSRSLRAGRISDNQSTYVEVSRSGPAGEVSFFCWVSSEYSDEAYYDYLSFRVDGVVKGRFDDAIRTLTLAVGYPASHPDTIAVGACTDFDYRSDYSQYGVGLDFLAPSSGGFGDVATTDRTGSDGYDAGGDYCLDFSGTSAATPLAAGVGALLLSADPTLTSAAARAILRATCDKIGPMAYDAAGWNSNYGYGRINAAAAVREADRRHAPPVLHAPLARADGAFECQISGGVGIRYVVEGSANLAAWTAVATNTIPAAGVTTVVDTSAVGVRCRFYRAVLR
jgi:subtilisin family serine protease